MPSLVFCLSCFLVPNSKNECPDGWIDCFCGGQLALIPLVAWATAALYAVDIYRVSDSSRKWIRLGILIGAVVSTVCFLFGVATLSRVGDVKWCLLVPFYIMIWYWVRAMRLIWTGRIRFGEYFQALGITSPFWAAGIMWAHRCYKLLPDQQTDCFVVTAATRGHSRVIGPFMQITRRGQERTANRQLITFWELEALWRVRSSGTHAFFRAFYNRFGPGTGPAN